MGNINPNNGPFQNSKGDIVGGNGTGAQPAIISVGSDKQVLTANSSATGGFDWENLVSSGTFSPTISFGGGSTGITYSTQQGSYKVIGPIVFFKILVTLSNKGSSTGNSFVQSLPFTSANDGFKTQSGIVPSNITFTASHIVANMNVQPNSTDAQVTCIGSGLAGNRLTDANFTNTSSIAVSGFYFTA